MRNDWPRGRSASALTANGYFATVTCGQPQSSSISIFIFFIIVIIIVVVVVDW
jgi:hypothetical protein